jgi:uncharacterized protein YcfJ
MARVGVTVGAAVGAAVGRGVGVAAGTGVEVVAGVVVGTDVGVEVVAPAHAASSVNAMPATATESRRPRFIRYTSRDVLPLYSLTIADE